MPDNQNTLKINVCKKSFDALVAAKKGTTIVIAHNQYNGEVILKKLETQMPARKLTFDELKVDYEKRHGCKVEIVEEGQSEKYRKTKAEKFIKD